MASPEGWVETHRVKMADNRKLTYVLSSAGAGPNQSASQNLRQTQIVVPGEGQDSIKWFLMEAKIML